MAFKFIILAALVAITQAGGPAAYNIATASSDYSSVGYTQESTQKGYGGQNVITSYSKSVNSPHSSVQVNNERVSNDASYLTHAIQPAAYAAQIAPVFTKAYAAPAYTTYAHSAPIIAKTTYAAPAIATYSQAAPLVTKNYAAPAAFTTYAHAAPAFATYAQATAPVYAKTYAAAPAYTTYAQPAPVLAKAVQTAPVYGYAATAAHAPVVHASFTGIGANYAW